MSVEEFALAFGRSRTVTQDGFYTNSNGQTGYWARLRNNDRWYSVSVSNTDFALTPDEVALALLAPDRRIERNGTYRNRKGVLGFEATVRVAEHTYMLSANNI